MAPSLLVESFKAMVVSATANWQACEGTHIFNLHTRQTNSDFGRLYRNQYEKCSYLYIHLHTSKIIFVPTKSHILPHCAQL
jgi:hypothetical protein